MRAYAEQTNRQNRERRAQVEADCRSLEKIERGIKGIMDVIEDDMYQPAMKARMEELALQKAEINARLAEAPADLPDIHPNIAEHYRAKVIGLAETLIEPESNGEAREDIRSLVGEVVITPGEKSRRPTRRVDGYPRSCCRPSQVFQTGSYNKRACVSPFEPTSRPSPMFCDQTRFRSRRQRTCSPGRIPGRNSIRISERRVLETAAIPADSARALDHFW